MRVRVVSATIALAVLALTLWVIAQPQPDSSIAKGRESIPTDLRKVLESGDIFLLLQIDPLPSAMRAEAGLPPLRLFHDYGIIQTVPITNQADRRRILDALYKGVSDLDFGGYMKCFNPRHGISVTLSNQVADLVVCFECFQVHAFSAHTNYQWTTLDAPQPTFNAYLQKARQP